MLNELKQGKEKLCVIGLGYVGLPLAVAFSKHFSVIGYDQNAEKIAAYRSGIDPSGEISFDDVDRARITFADDESVLDDAVFYVVAVPTPINGDKTPDLTPLRGATRAIGRHMKKGSIVVYESTVYPGVTEDVCLPLLEEESGLGGGTDFKVGYSPERINPGDTVNRLENIVKIVSGMDASALDTIAAVYSTVVQRIHRASSIRVAEAAKVAENAQRDINIAFMNELAMAFHRMDVDTGEVVDAMNTKWNALGFTPGLVGGHCIGIDPYYFIYEAQNLGFHSELIETGRRINDRMSSYVANAVVRGLMRAQVNLATARVYLMGMTFKEDCPDVRNSRAADVYHVLSDYRLNLWAVDPQADAEDLRRTYDIGLTPLTEICDADCIVYLVPHEEFRRLTWTDQKLFFRADGPRLMIDVKRIFSKEDAEAEGYQYWSL